MVENVYMVLMCLGCLQHVVSHKTMQQLIVLQESTTGHRQIKAEPVLCLIKG